ncbi:MAG: hypothetical protein EOP82_08470 [Variovorax sp.]|nr:MAG: hypothetical protein EOP82_08470 [Variovorax sp.]
MKKIKNVLAVAAAATLALAAGSAIAESQYGYNAAGTGTVTATARVNLKVTVPKLVLLRVGSADTAVNEIAWTATPTVATIATLNSANNQPGNWDGTAPAFPNFTAGASTPATIAVFAWTNATTGTINCSVGAFSAAGGPTASSFSVVTTGSLPHPAVANLGACASTTFASNTLASGTWAYKLTGDSQTWKAGDYTSTVTYTATGI